jgi:hypothetical protein
MAAGDKQNTHATLSPFLKGFAGSFGGVAEVRRTKSG